MTRPASPPFDLILITEPALMDPVKFVRLALSELDQGGRVAVQLRAKDWSAPQRLDAARALREITRQAQSHLLINGDLALCAAVAADGVQLPEDGPTLTAARETLGKRGWLGVSCHDQTRLTHAAQARADFAVLSPWGDVPNKGPALGPHRFGALCRSTDLAVYALGGISLRQIPETIAQGARGIAVIRQVHQAPQPATWVRDALQLIDRARRHSD